MPGKTLVEKISSELTKRKKKIATAESCTGGLIAHTLTNISGSSNFFERGIVSYSNEARERALIFISKMNPYVKVTKISRIKDGESVTDISYTAEREKPVLIPLIKFISE